MPSGLIQGLTALKAGAMTGFEVACELSTKRRRTPTARQEQRTESD